MKSFKKQMAYLGSVSGRDEDKIGKAGLTPVYANRSTSGRLQGKNTIYFEEAKLVLVCNEGRTGHLALSPFGMEVV